MNARQRRKITQTTGAQVQLEDKLGIVTGHYDDDIVFIQLAGEDESHPTYVDALTLVEG